MTDTAEYWDDVHRKARWVHLAERKAKKPAHDCKPRGGPKGTHNRWKCKVCGRRFASRPGEEYHA